MEARHESKKNSLQGHSKLYKVLLRADSCCSSVLKGSSGPAADEEACAPAMSTSRDAYMAAYRTGEKIRCRKVQSQSRSGGEGLLDARLREGIGRPRHPPGTAGSVATSRLWEQHRNNIVFARILTFADLKYVKVRFFLPPDHPHANFLVSETRESCREWVFTS